jgi:hypothetical protein
MTTQVSERPATSVIGKMPTEGEGFPALGLSGANRKLLGRPTHPLIAAFTRLASPSRPRGGRAARLAAEDHGAVRFFVL